MEITYYTQNGKINYTHNDVLTKAARCTWSNNTIVRIVEELPFGKVKVETYGFDFPFAYSLVNRIGYDIIEKKDIRELNWDNLIHDLISEGYNWKFHVLKFIRRFYPFHCLQEGFSFDPNCKSCLYWDGKKFAETTENIKNLPDWCKGYSELLEIDEIMKHMISIGVETENAEEMRRVIRTETAAQKLVIPNKKC
jgi:hypothetical protein